MKNFTFAAALLLLSSNIFSQALEDTEKIAEAEMKSAYSITNFVANLNTGNYDVVYQRLKLSADPAVHFISGDVTTHYRAKGDMASITFDLSGQLTVSAVTRSGSNLDFLQNANNELIITLPTTQGAGVLDSLTVSYSGPPSTGEEAFVTSTHNGNPILWTLSEPYGAKDWWPCKQDLIDKIDSIDVYITAPEAYVSVSNGLEISSTANGNGTKTTHFHHGYPIPAYLVAIGITNYSIFTQQAGTEPNTFPVVNYIYPETQASSESQLAVTVPIMNLYEQLFETYPFHEEKYGHAQCGFSGGMEHTTVSFVGSFSRELIAHELGHQWFGDKVTCGSWKDIWLNEGFATYMSGLVVENFDGSPSFISWRNSRINSITSSAGGNLYLTDTDTLSVNRIFDDRLTYNKGGMVLHMLRFKLGDPAFFQGLKNYLADPGLAYNYAKTPDLQSHLEAASGSDLSEFFNDWVYMQGYPVYSITAQDWGEGQAKVVISQSQSHPSVSFFEMPVPVRLLGPEGQILDVTLDNTVNGEEFLVPITFPVTGVAFDPEKNIISKNSSASLGKEDFSLLSGIRLYPNPATGQLNAVLPDGILLKKAAFYNAIGQKVMEATEAGSWNVSGLPAGVYSVTLLTDKGNIPLRFIKK